VNTYDPHTTLDAISRNVVPVVVIGGLSIVAMFVFFIEAPGWDNATGLSVGAVDDRATRLSPAGARIEINGDSGLTVLIE
jgi:hypothetical protein